MVATLFVRQAAPGLLFMSALVRTTASADARTNNKATTRTTAAEAAVARAEQAALLNEQTAALAIANWTRCLSGHSALQPTAQHSPDTDAGLKQAPPPPSLSPHHHTAQGNPCKSTTTPGPTTTATSNHARILSSSTQQPTQTPPAALENRQIPPPSPSPSTAAGTYIQDPSLGILLPGTITPTATPSNTSSNASISTAVIVTIVLGTIAGVVTVSLVVILINMQLRRRRRRGGQPCSPTESDKKGLSANASSTVLNSPGLASPFPKMATSAPPMAPGTEIPAKGGNDVRLDELRPPPRLGERRFHQITRSEGSIEVRPSRSLHHTRWGKPSSLGNIPSAKDMPSYYVGDGQTHDHASPDSRSPGRNHQYNLFPTRTTPPAIKTHKPAASTSTTSTLQGTGATPPRTPKSGVLSPVNGLVSPGPPPTRALPSPPLKYWQVNPLSPPLDSQMDHVRPEEIGVAIGSPTTEERREKRPRLDESDMERLGGTYSPFRR
ncbi:hypothetical protein H634G_02786 [Metarhizium anisopliae BRIP 53293]|uniref:Uncharacterized protein n=1 Tax=Metarhizium anisopliae BRIP 53293 TaxID=1291518 RepID=A0A0D9P619_METAN|nr:hypothetical protein H634G_02786 [Metarhizium anisopliae BRIP 53293]KJK86223.1 hypothetical protein H633G_09931 [Metarhizium anisopliae BRIP 53284]